MAELLIELLSEEIPARMQARAAADLARLMTAGLAERGLAHGPARAFVTPRRLVLHVADVAPRSPDIEEERRGPREGAPEKALAGFARSAGVTVEELELRETPKGRFWFATRRAAGRPAEAIIAEALGEVIRGFPWPKSMRWGSHDLRWVRPLHSILAILTDENGSRVVDFEIEGIRAANVSRGHRFMAPEPFVVAGFDDYARALDAHKVVLDPKERSRRIREGAARAGAALGLELVEDRGLLEEVTGLAEWPVPLAGRIETRFLDLPPEVLQTSMREHQKFFSLRNPQSGQIEGFVTVADREAPDGGAAILAGNARVLAARLADARFFWENDLRVAREEKLRPWLEALEHVTFHNKLGTVGERSRRVAELAERLAPKVGADPALAREAARFAKADLVSEMVYEFPELQGVMGRYYLDAAGFPGEVAAAAEEHYKPVGPSDAVPRAPVSLAVALADKLDMLAGFWAIGEKPTGSKDPFALRRAALGVIRILFENDLRLSLREVIALARSDVDIDDLLAFFHDRLKVHLKEKGIRHDVIDAVLGLPGNDDLLLLARRAEALAAFLATEEGENLVQGFRRANNILAAEERKDGVSYELDPDPKFAETKEERALFAALDAAEARIRAALEAEDHAGAMAAIADLRQPIDAFFESTVVNAENSIIRRNRLCLLNRIRTVCGQVADLSRLEG